MSNPKEKWPLTRAVEVEWMDHCSHGRWVTPSEQPTEMAKCRTIGYVVQDGKTTLTLAQSQSCYTGHCADTIVIGKKLITRRRRIG